MLELHRAARSLLDTSTYNAIMVAIPEKQQPIKGGRWKKGESGNPKGRPKLEHTLTECLREIVATRSSELTNALVDLAIGCTVKDFDKQGEERIYTIAPNERAIALIFDRLEGRAVQSIALGGPDGAPISVEVIRNIVADSDG